MARFNEFQKALTFRRNRVHYPCIAQPKINGGRCGSAFDQTPGKGLFDSTSGTFKLHSKEDIDLPVEHIKTELNNAAIEYPWLKNLILDGEIYQRGLKVATINGAARNSKNPVHDKLQYVIFDVINNDVQQKRMITVSTLEHLFYVGDWNKHNEWPLSKVIVLPHVIIHNDEEAKHYRDLFISLGFEGIILRELHAKYTPGKHVDVMWKYKDFEIDNFKVVDIIPRPIDTHLPMFILRNDVTTETFECIPTGTHTKQAKMLINKNKYIGTMVDVKYYERTINKLPFNANVLTNEL